jgi:heme O synthase-like polyprenyltransferase
MSVAVALRLGRISNLPTVWTNVLVGVVIAGGAVTDARVLLLVLAFSLFYIAGMYLNDYFDREIDARERPERPIPSGRVSAATVSAAGFAMLVLGALVLVLVGWSHHGTEAWRPALAGAALAAAIVYYDWHHKRNPLSPVWMGVCRMLVYLGAGLAVASQTSLDLWCAGGVLLCYLIGLTYIAKQETLGEVRNLWPLAFLAVPVGYGVTVALESAVGAVLFLAFLVWMCVALGFLWRRRPGDVPRAVVGLIAGIALLDAVLIAGAGAAGVAWLAALAFPLTLAFQRLVPGT